MQSVTFDCEIITPMFMAGADTRIPEIRPPSVKGMMRFWWRAVKGMENTKKLFEEEAEIFGSTEGKSKILLKISTLSLSILDANDTLWGLIPYKVRVSKKRGKQYNVPTDESKGVSYLLYSTVLEPQRKLLPPGHKITITLQSGDKDAFKKSVASLWCAIYLGGFGTRARRGGGNLAVNNINCDVYGLSFAPEASNPDELAEWLCENYKKAHRLICGREQPERFVTTYSNLSFSRFILSRNSFNTWIEALNDVGRVFEDFRYQHRKDIFGSAVFGLPVRHNKFTVKGRGIERRGSPLIFKVLKADRRYYWMVLRLTGEFLSQQGVLTDGRSTQKPDFKLVDEFWCRLKNNGNGNEKEKEYILSQPEILNMAVEKIKREINPVRIMLFGSRARGDAHHHADIDLAVETEDPISKIELQGPFDIVPISRADKLLQEKIKKEGVLLYERKA